MKPKKQATVSYKESVPVFTEEMKKEYTILAPNMLPYHFDILADVMREKGYRIEILKTEGRSIIDEGLKHVHNDTCYPALCVVGQFIDALKSGKYDVNKTALVITQSGGGCRASNYVPLLRKALKAEFPQVLFTALLVLFPLYSSVHSFKFPAISYIFCFLNVSLAPVVNNLLAAAVLFKVVSSSTHVVPLVDILAFSLVILYKVGL